jgi:hypothetical protein
MKITRIIATFALFVAVPLSSSLAAPKQYTFKKGELTCSP